MIHVILDFLSKHYTIFYKRFCSNNLKFKVTVILESNRMYNYYCSDSVKIRWYLGLKLIVPFGSFNPPAKTKTHVQTFLLKTSVIIFT